MPSQMCGNTHIPLLFFLKKINRSHSAIATSQATKKIGYGEKKRRKEKTNPLTTFYRGFSLHKQGISD
jgi:hypothetical protein